MSNPLASNALQSEGDLRMVPIFPIIDLLKRVLN